MDESPPFIINSMCAECTRNSIEKLSKFYAKKDTVMLYITEAAADDGKDLGTTE
jgi:hypothetical protein